MSIENFLKICLIGAIQFKARIGLIRLFQVGLGLVRFCLFVLPQNWWTKICDKNRKLLVTPAPLLPKVHICLWGIHPTNQFWLPHFMLVLTFCYLFQTECYNIKHTYTLVHMTCWIHLCAYDMCWNQYNSFRSFMSKPLCLLYYLGSWWGRYSLAS